MKLTKKKKYADSAFCFRGRFWNWPMKSSVRPSHNLNGMVGSRSAGPLLTRRIAQRREGWRARGCALCPPVAQSERDGRLTPAGPLLTRGIAQRREGWRARGCAGGTVAAAPEAGWLLLFPILILLRALAIVFVLRRFLNLWLKITPRLQLGPSEVLRNLLHELVIAPRHAMRGPPTWHRTMR